MNTAKPFFPTGPDRYLYNQLRREVHQLVDQLEPRRRRIILFKAFFFPAFYWLTYAAALTWGSKPYVFYCCYLLLGLLTLFLFLNTVHDAVHGTVFRSKQCNNVYVYLFDLMGANSYIWKLRHIRFHHNYPNVEGWDTDIEQSSLFRVFPSGPVSPLHRYQHLYLPFFYPFYLPNWLLRRDFKDFFNQHKMVRKLTVIPKSEYVKLFLFKALFLGYIIGVPLMRLPLTTGQVLGAFALMMFTASIVSLLVLLSPHANVDSDFPLPDTAHQLPHSWMWHMLRTTNDVSNDNWFIRNFMGCFNYHVVHHLFPHINHIYYPEITALLKNYAAQYQLPYRSFSLSTSLKKHYQLLKRNGRVENIFEETM